MVDAAKNNISGLEHMVELYATQHDGEFPANVSRAAQRILWTGNGNAMPPYTDRIPSDPWGQPLLYEFPNTRSQRALKPAIWSSGPNKPEQEGAGDDINNWKRRRAVTRASRELYAANHASPCGFRSIRVTP